MSEGLSKIILTIYEDLKNLILWLPHQIVKFLKKIKYVMNRINIRYKSRWFYSMKLRIWSVLSMKLWGDVYSLIPHVHGELHQPHLDFAYIFITHHLGKDIDQYCFAPNPYTNFPKVKKYPFWPKVEIEIKSHFFLLKNFTDYSNFFSLLLDLYKREMNQIQNELNVIMKEFCFPLLITENLEIDLRQSKKNNSHISENRGEA